MQRKPNAFTLIELLVVISIIALLISILLPALSSARKSAQGMSCLSNERQMAIALLAYANDEQSYLPFGYEPGVRDWLIAITGYIRAGKGSYSADTKASGVFTCPAASIPGGTKHYAVHPIMMPSYNATPAGFPLDKTYRIDRAKRTSELLILADSNQSPGGDAIPEGDCDATLRRLNGWGDPFGTYMTSPNQWYYDGSFADNFTPIETNGVNTDGAWVEGYIRWRHSADTTAAVLFLDGHATQNKNEDVLLRNIRPDKP